MEDAETEVLANLGALVTLGPFAPLPIEVHSRRHTGLSGEVGHNAGSDILTAIREAPLELESLDKNGETESGGAGLVAQ